MIGTGKGAQTSQDTAQSKKPGQKAMDELLGHVPAHEFGKHDHVRYHKKNGAQYQYGPLASGEGQGAGQANACPKEEGIEQEH